MTLKTKTLGAAIAALFAASAWCAPIVLHDAGVHASGDKMGDAQKITELRLDSGSGKLSVSATLAASPYIKVGGDSAVVTGKVLTVAIDADSDPGTGMSVAFAHDVKGVESQIDVKVCAEEQGAAKPHCTNGMWGRKLKGGIALAVAAGKPGAAAAAPLARTGIPDQGDTFNVQIPYARLGLTAGKSIRIYLLGWKGGMFTQLFEPATLTLN